MYHRHRRPGILHGNRQENNVDFTHPELEALMHAYGKYTRIWQKVTLLSTGREMQHGKKKPATVSALV